MNPVLKMLLSKKKPIIKDSFNRADTAGGLGTAETGQLWQYFSTNRFNISSNTARVNSTSSDVAYINAGRANVKISVTISNFVDGVRPIAFRILNTSNLWTLRTTATEYKLYRGKTAMGTYTVVPTTGDKIAVTIKNDVITVYLNGASIISVTDAALNTSTNVGISHSNSLGATLDNFLVEAI